MTGPVHSGHVNTPMNGAVERLVSAVGKALAIAVPFLLFAYGTWSFPLAVFDPSRALLPGDLGDSRFNNYILEHFHQYAVGSVDDYWDAPFMYPYKNVIAFSDNLLGTAPLYSLFRHVGFNRESAYQLWILALFSLNYWCCFLALYRWSKRSAISACGAYMFAFGIHMIGHMDHAQVFPKFMVPLAFWWCWQWLQRGGSKFLVLTTVAVVYQFYCGIYLGFMLCYCLLFLCFGHVLAHARDLRRYLPSGTRKATTGVVILGVGAALLLPLMLPYLEVSQATGMRTFDEVKNTIPRPSGYFFTHPAAVNWLSLSQHSQFAFDEWWSQFHFMGGLPWLALLLLPFVLWKSTLVRDHRQGLIALFIAFLLATLFCLRIGDFTLYRLINKLPGFNALRAIDRFMPVLAMYFAALMVHVFTTLTVRPSLKFAVAICLPLLVVADNKIDVRSLKRYDKHMARELVERARLDIQMQVDRSDRALAYTPVRGVIDFGEDHQRTIEMHLTAMLAAQELQMPVVNAYTGSYPGNYLKFWDGQDQRTLNDWCAFNGITSSGIRLVNNAHEPIIASDTVEFFAPNGKYVCLQPSQWNQAIADRDSALRWETFVRLELADRHYAFVTHNDRFLTAELHRDSGLVATSDRLGDMGRFTIEEHGSDTIALRADNGRYVILDEHSSRLFAKGDSTDARRLFLLKRPTRPSLHK